MNVDDIFKKGLHNLTNEQLLVLANSQDVLLRTVDKKDLVYIIQELTSRIEDLADHRASELAAIEFNG